MTHTSEVLPVEQCDRDEWTYAINYGPDGEANYANVYDEKGDLVGNLRTHHAIKVCAATRPSPASPDLCANSAQNSPASHESEVERVAVARCIAIAREVRDGFLSEEYAVNQPESSFSERFACDQVARAIEDEFALGTSEQRALLKAADKPEPQS